MKTLGCSVLIVASLVTVAPPALSAERSLFDLEKYDRNGLSTFALTNRPFIKDISDLNTGGNELLVGLKIKDKPVDEWRCADVVSTNIRYLEVSTSTPILGRDVFDGLLRYPNLEYLVLSCGTETVVPACTLRNLTNLTHLRGLWLYDYGTTNIPAEIWGIKTLEELLLSVGAVEFPDGISRLSELRQVTIKVQGGKALRRLPRDMA